MVGGDNRGETAPVASAAEKEIPILDFETEWLRNVILLHEKSFEKAVFSFQKSAAPKFVPDWMELDQQKFRYNTPFQRDALAKAYVERGEIEKAIAEYERLITFDPTKPARVLIHPLCHYRPGKLYEQKGLTDKAKAQYQRFLGLWKDADPGQPEVRGCQKTSGDFAKFWGAYQIQKFRTCPHILSKAPR